MNAAQVLESPLARPDEFIAVESLDTEAGRELSASASEVVKRITGTQVNLVMSAIKNTSGTAFKTAREEAFRKYFQSMIALSMYVQAVTPPSVIQQLTLAGLDLMEETFRADAALLRFGLAVRDQAVFTVWTFRKANNLLRELASVPPTDIERMKRIAASTTWARFHLDCLTLSMLRNVDLYPEVSELVVDGLRSAVNAYADVRLEHDAHFKKPTLFVENAEWDDEDAALLAESRRDLPKEIF
jgi:hypothetical protein